MSPNNAPLETFDSLLAQSLEMLHAPCQTLQAAMIYSSCGGGKRTRAKLCYLVADALDLPRATSDPIAMAIECLHAYTLIHDDLPAMDDDDLRRHKASCHKAFDEATAILAGDALQTHAFELLASTPIAADRAIIMVRHFCQHVGAKGLCSGQSLDMLQTAHATSIDTLTGIALHKTAVLLGCALALPGIAAGLDKADWMRLQAAGEHLGMILQINDDLLDASTDSAHIGKTPGKDEAANKATFLTQLGEEKALHALADYQDKLTEQLAAIKHLPDATKAAIGCMLQITPG